MVLSKAEHKKHPFPLRIFLTYLILLIAGMALLDVFSMFLIQEDATDGFIATVLSMVLMLAAFFAGWFVFAIVFWVVQGKKIYRGLGLHRVAAIACVLFTFAFIGLFTFMKMTNGAYTLFHVWTLLLECAVPFAMLVLVKQFTPICPKCGLANTYKLSKIETDDLGRDHKFHNEGGYQQRWMTSVGMMIQDVPTRAVYDGLFERKKTTKSYICCVCGALNT